MSAAAIQFVTYIQYLYLAFTGINIYSVPQQVIWDETKLQAAAVCRQIQRGETVDERLEKMDDVHDLFVDAARIVQLKILWHAAAISSQKCYQDA